MLKRCLVFIVIGLSFTVHSSEITARYGESISETLKITSTANNQEYELYIQLPPSYQTSKKSYPVAILQDVRVTVPEVEKALNNLGGKDVENIILVGISYSIGTPPKISRTRDFTPTYAPNEKGAHSLEAQKHSGKAGEYIQFLGDDLIPLLQKKYRINEEKKIFIGHSFGGLLGVYTLLVNADLFDSYIISSPSLWYDNRAIFHLEDAFSKENTSMNAHVLMYIGELESQSKRGNMVQDLLNLERILKSRNYEGLNVNATVVDGASHFNSLPQLLPEALLELIPKEKL